MAYYSSLNMKDQWLFSNTNIPGIMFRVVNVDQMDAKFDQHNYHAGVDISE